MNKKNLFSLLLLGMLLFPLSGYIYGCSDSGSTPSNLECVKDSDCLPNQKCEDNKCITTGLYCDTLMDCPSGFICENHVCVRQNITPDGDEEVADIPDSSEQEIDKSEQEIPEDIEQESEPEVVSEDEMDSPTESEIEDIPMEQEPDISDPDVMEDSITDGDVSEIEDSQEGDSNEISEENDSTIDTDLEEGDLETNETSDATDGDVEADLADEEPADTAEVVDAEESTETDGDMDESPSEQELDTADESQVDAEPELSCDDVGTEGICVGDVLYTCTAGNLNSQDCAAEGKLCQWWDTAHVYYCLGGEGSACGGVNPPCARGYECQSGTCHWVGECSPGAETCTNSDAYVCGDDELWHVKQDCPEDMPCALVNGSAVCTPSTDGDTDISEQSDELDSEAELDVDESVDVPDVVEEDGAAEMDIEVDSELDSNPEQEVSDGEEAPEPCGDVTELGYCEGDVLVFCDTDTNTLMRVDCAAHSMICEDVGGGDHWCVSQEGGYCNNPPPIYCRHDLICFANECVTPSECTENGWLQDGDTSGDTANGAANFSPSCVRYNANGNELLYMLHINEREWAELTLTPQTSDRDPVIYVLNSCDPNDCLISADDHAAGSAEKVAVGSQTGADVIVGADKYGEGTMQFVLNLTRHKAQDCSNPVQISGSTTIEDTTLFQFDDYNSQNVGTCSSGEQMTGTGYDKIYHFSNPTGEEVHITLTPSDSSVDVGMYVLNSCEPSNGACMISRNAAAAGAEETLTVTATDFFLVVDANVADGSPKSFAYTLAVTYGTPDPCASVRLINSNTTFTDSTSGGSNDYNTGVFGSCSDGNSATGRGYDKIYHIVNTSGNDATITVSPNSGDVVLFLLDTCTPSSASCYYCADTGLDGEAETIVVSPSQATDFYVVVDGYHDNEAITYSMSVSFDSSGCNSKTESTHALSAVLLILALAHMFRRIRERRSTTR